MTYIMLLFLLAILPCTLTTSTISTNKLFQNTIKRWNIGVSSDKDRVERWKRFARAKESVDRTTRGVTLESLSLFSVLNDNEYEQKVGPLRRQLLQNGSSLEGLLDEVNLNLKKRSYAVKEIADSYTYWEDTVGMNPPIDQYGCGSCWSFPTVATIEALYKEQTGETVHFSQQYFVDCTFEGDGCGGGEIHDGYKLTMMRQYLMSREDWPYTSEYQECQFADQIATFTNNALKKLWVTSYVPLSTNENALLYALLTSPVAFGSYVSTDILHYSGGVWTDSRCSSDPKAHAMLLVGYTETILRVQNSYGSEWGDGGYVSYERGTATLEACNFYKSAYSLTTTFRREMQYEWCNDKKTSTWGDCKASCDAMNTEGETGWTLAVIPTKYHNTLVINMIDAVYPGVKNDDKFNYVWIGLTDMEKTTEYAWADGFTPVKYSNITETVAKYGMINKNTGTWLFRNSLTYKARGMCSRAVTCWDISTSVENGNVAFDQDPLVEGTVATVTCNEDYSLDGTSTFSCTGGTWSAELPTCLPAGITITPAETSVSCLMKATDCYIYFSISGGGAAGLDQDNVKCCKLKDNGDTKNCKTMEYVESSAMYRRLMKVKSSAGAGVFVGVVDGTDEQSEPVTLTVD